MPTCLYNYIVTCNGKDVANSNGLYCKPQRLKAPTVQQQRGLDRMNVNKIIIENAHNIIGHA